MSDGGARSLATLESLTPLMEKILNARGGSLTNSRRLASAVKQLSDFFIAQPKGATPWDRDWAVEAYFSYYLALNEIRVRAAALEGVKLGFFEGLENVIDFGAGPGTAGFALRATVPSLKNFLLVERSSVPAKVLREAGEADFEVHQNLDRKQIKDPAKTLFVASYSLTEAEIPQEALSCEAIMILEPSTQEDGRALLDLRDRLRAEGYTLWAPCTHQMECPLKKNSKRDWCHDRVHVDRPEWLMKVEEQLPFRNRTITFSYILARKKPRPALPSTVARLVGDRLKEKGKDRQMICRGEEREFLAWMHKHGEPQDLPRGVLIDVPEDILKTSNEIRVDRTLKKI